MKYPVELLEKLFDTAVKGLQKIYSEEFGQPIGEASLSRETQQRNLVIRTINELNAILYAHELDPNNTINVPQNEFNTNASLYLDLTKEGKRINVVDNINHNLVIMTTGGRLGRINYETFEKQDRDMMQIFQEEGYLDKQDGQRS